MTKFEKCNKSTQKTIDKKTMQHDTNETCDCKCSRKVNRSAPLVGTCKKYLFEDLTF